MSQRATILTLTRAVEALSEASSLKGLFHKHQAGAPLPSGQRLQEIVEISRSILFPGFYGKATLHLSTLEYHIGVNVQRLHALLSEQIHAGLCFAGDQDKSQEEQSEERFSPEVIRQLFILEYAPNGMWTYFLSVYFMNNKDNDNMLDNDKLYLFLRKIQM